MNFLGHAALARQGTDEQLFGCLIADGVKGQLSLKMLPSDVRQGIVHHRLVDATIDAHPAVLALVKQMPTRRFAAIALDVIWDYCLHHSALAIPNDGWSPLIQRCHSVIQSADWLPPSKAVLLQRMVEGRWLMRSADLSFSMDTIIGIGRQLRRPQDLSSLCKWVIANIDILQHAFISIWQDLWQLTNIATGSSAVMINDRKH